MVFFEGHFQPSGGYFFGSIKRISTGQEWSNSITVTPPLLGWFKILLGKYQYNFAHDAQVDHIRVRKYASPEPTASIGNEEAYNYSSEYSWNVSVSSGASKLVAAIYWYSTSPSTSAVMSLVKPDGSVIEETQAPTLVKSLGSSEGVYSGYRSMSVSNPVSGTWQLRANVTSQTKLESEAEVMY